MNSNQRKLFAAAVLGSAIVSAGCSADVFNSVNSGLKTIQTAGKAVGNVRIPTAAVASALGGMELVKALTSDGAEAKSSGIIAAGGGNIIAAGGGNYELLAFKLGEPVEKQLSDNGVKATLKYSSKLDDDKKTLTSTIDSFEGDTNGYQITIKGATFSYIMETGGTGRTSFFLGSPATLFKAGKNGEELDKSKDFTATIKTLNFDVSDPMPDQALYIGQFVMEVKDGGEIIVMTADFGRKDKKMTFDASLEFKDSNGVTKLNADKKPDIKYIKFDQDNPKFEPYELNQEAITAREKVAKERAEAQSYRDCRILKREGKEIPASCDGKI